MSTNKVSELIDRFICISEGLEKDPDFESTFGMLVSLWKMDSDLCCMLLHELAKRSNEIRGVVDAIGIAQKELDEQFDNFIYSITKLRDVPKEFRTQLQMFLVSIQFEKSIRDFNKTFKSGCSRFMEGKYTDQELENLVSQACILGQKSLYSEIDKLLEILSQSKQQRPFLHIDISRRIEVMVRYLEKGAKIAIEKLSSNQSEVSEKEAAAFVLGCERNAAHYDILSKAFYEFDGRYDYPIRRECVGAIVYAARSDDALKFISSALQKERENFAAKSSWWSRLPSRDADRLCLLIAAYFFPIINVSLIDELRKWLQVEHDDYTAYAHLALEKHGITDPHLEHMRSNATRRARNYLEKTFSYSDLVRLRCYTSASS